MDSMGTAVKALRSNLPSRNRSLCLTTSSITHPPIPHPPAHAQQYGPASASGPQAAAGPRQGRGVCCHPHQLGAGSILGCYHLPEHGRHTWLQGCLSHQPAAVGEMAPSVTLLKPACLRGMHSNISAPVEVCGAV
jgi:hypothetical protein